ncbi:MAG TPA: DUF4833 domain-containing protein [Chitinophagaceae bacterium]|nr:DUF4833 domain-containing protein [Chitinophagaceae bacterium]
MKTGLLKYFFFTALLFNCGVLLSQNTSPADTFPVPSGNMYQLFYLQRQPNTNTIVVELRVKEGKVDDEIPVHVFWQRYTEDGKRAELNFIQRKFAYGIQTKKIADGIFDLNFVSYRKIKFRLERGKDNFWRVYANLVNGSRMILRRVYLHINGGSFWKPRVEYVELKGNDPVTYKEIRERVFLQ